MGRPSRPSVTLQAKLVVGAAGDAFEREADRVADELMRRAGARALGDEPDPEQSYREDPPVRVSRQTIRGVERGIDLPPELAAQVERLRGGGMPLAGARAGTVRAAAGRRPRLDPHPHGRRRHADRTRPECARLCRRVRHRVRFRPVPAGNRQRAPAARPRARAYGSAAGYRARASRGFVGAMQERHRGRHRRREGSTAQTMGPLDHHPRYPVASGTTRSRQWTSATQVWSCSSMSPESRDAGNRSPP